MILNLMKFWRLVHHLMVCLVLTMNLYVDFSRMFFFKKIFNFTFNNKILCTILFYGVFCVKLDAYLNQWNHWLNEMLDWVCLHDFYFIKHILPLIYLYRTNKSNRLTETKSIGLKLNTIQYLSIEKTLAHTRTMDKSKIGITTEYIC